MSLCLLFSLIPMLMLEVANIRTIELLYYKIKMLSNEIKNVLTCIATCIVGDGEDYQKR